MLGEQEGTKESSNLLDSRCQCNWLAYSVQRKSREDIL
jgi:hypothetical protein